MQFDGLAISARGISARGSRGCSFANVSLDVGAGRLAAIVGPGGSGRTSLLLALAGRLQLTTGTVHVGPYRLPGDARDVRRRVAVAQAHPAVDTDEQLRVDELIFERTRIGGTHASGSAIAETCAVVGLAVPPGLAVGDLAPADRTLLAVVLAASQRPGAIVVDDVDRGCTTSGSARVWRALQALADRGATVLASSTRLPEHLDQADLAVTPLTHPLERDTISETAQE